MACSMPRRFDEQPRRVRAGGGKMKTKEGIFGQRGFILTLSALCLLLLSSPALAEGEKPKWDAAGKEIKEAAKAVGEASKETWQTTREKTAEALDKAKDKGEEVWQKTKEKSAEAVQKTKTKIHEATAPQSQTEPASEAESAAEPESAPPPAPQE